MINKKAQIELEILDLLIILLVGSLMVFIGYKFVKGYNDSLYDTSSNDEKKIIDNTAKVYTNFDYLPLLIIIVYAIVEIFLSYMGSNNPLFLIISIILFIPIIIFGGTSSNIFQNLNSSSAFSGFDTIYPITFAIMTNLPTFAIILFALNSFAFYLGTRSDFV